jgi:hypothetical protein
VEVSYIYTPVPEGETVQHACSGIAFMAQVTSGYPVFWSYSPDGNPIAGNGLFFEIPNPQQDFFLYAFAQGDECPSLPLELIIDVGLTAEDIVLEYPETACAEGTWWISSSVDTDEGYWIQPGGETVEGNAVSIPLLSPSDEGEYTFIYESPWCPPVEIDYILEFNAPEILTVEASSPGPWCEGDNLTLNLPDVAGASGYFWTLPDGQRNQFRNLSGRSHRTLLQSSDRIRECRCCAFSIRISG